MTRIAENKTYLIRKSKFSDYTSYARWETDSVVREFLSYDEDRTYEDVVYEGIGYKGNPTVMDLAIVDKKVNEPVGRVLITRIDEHCDSLDITKLYIGDPEHRGKGAGTQIMKLLLEYCFTFMHMERVSIDYYTGNERARTLYEKLGFKSEGKARNATKKDGRYYDLNLMSMLRSEFFSD